MKFESKYDINDVVYFMMDNKVHSSKIEYVRCAAWITQDFKQYSSTLYKLRDVKHDMIERDLFGSKEELLKSL